MDYLDERLTARDRAIIESVYYGCTVYRVDWDDFYGFPQVGDCLYAAYSSRIYKITETFSSGIFVRELPEGWSGELADYTFDWSKAELIE